MVAPGHLLLMSDFLDSTQWCSMRYPVEKRIRRVKNSDVSDFLLAM